MKSKRFKWHGEMYEIDYFDDWKNNSLNFIAYKLYKTRTTQGVVVAGDSIRSATISYQNAPHDKFGVIIDYLIKKGDLKEVMDIL